MLFIRIRPFQIECFENDVPSGNWPELLQWGEVHHRRLQKQLLQLLNGHNWRQITKLLLWLFKLHGFLSLLLKLFTYLN